MHGRVWCKKIGGKFAVNFETYINSCFRHCLVFLSKESKCYSIKFTILSTQFLNMDHNLKIDHLHKRSIQECITNRKNKKTQGYVAIHNRYQIDNNTSWLMLSTINLMIDKYFIWRNFYAVKNLRISLDKLSRVKEKLRTVF